jgi:hypothetical protein
MERELQILGLRLSGIKEDLISYLNVAIAVSSFGSKHLSHGWRM